MARAISTDFLQSHFFTVTTGGAVDRFGRPTAANISVNLPAGFQSVTIPTASTDMVEYREGSMIYTRKQAGIPSFDDITMMRGVSRQDSSFFDWMRQVLEGTGEIREDLQIKQYHRDVALTRPNPPRGTGGVPGSNRTFIDPDARPAIIYHAFEAVPMSCKPAGDLDATNAEISIAELTTAIEYIEVEYVPVS